MTDHNREEREALIEKAAKAMLDDSHGEGTWEVRTPMEEELYLRRSRAALAVFEQAHTPTSQARRMSDHLRRYNDQAAKMCGCVSCRAWLNRTARAEMGDDLDDW